MSQTQTESKSTAAEVQPAVFVRMAAVVRMTVCVQRTRLDAFSVAACAGRRRSAR